MGESEKTTSVRHVMCLLAPSATSLDKRTQEKSPADIVCIEAAIQLECRPLAEIALEDVAVVADGG